MKSQLRFWQVVICLAFSTIFANAQFNRNAGVIHPLSKTAAATATSEKSGDPASKINDGDESSAWKSDAPLPSKFLSQAHNNYFLSASGTFSGSGGTGSTKIMDGDDNSKEDISKVGNSAWVKFSLAQATFTRMIGIKANNSADLKIWSFDAQGDSSLLGTYTTAQSYSVERFIIGIQITAIKIESNSSFSLFELGAVRKALYEDVILDLGTQKQVGYIYARLQSTNTVDSTQLSVSANGNTWTIVARPNPDVYFMAPYRANPILKGRYVRLRNFVKEADYARGELREIRIFDKNGMYGPMTALSTLNRPVKELMGVNTVWGWGNGNYSDKLNPGEGPELYNKVVTHARNYHNMSWDTPDPDQTPNYGGMPGSLNQGWMDWDREYQTWKNSGLTVQACIQFMKSVQPPSMWNNPYQAAYDYGFAFADHFGPGGNGLVERIEVGNEPWAYDSSFYRTVLHGMAKGAKTADPNMKVFSCALQSSDPSAEFNSLKNFMGARVSPTEIPYLDGVNVHHYSYKTSTFDGDRIATHPEDPASGMRGLLADIRFRNANLPGKEIYISEWGWDSDGANQVCDHGECVSEEAQALYAFRGMMMMDRLGVDRATWFFYANSDKKVSGIYRRCGLTAPVDSGSAPKRSFVTFSTMLDKIGNCYFLDTLAENDDVWAYLYGDSLGNATHVVAWKPIAADNPAKSIFEINFPQIVDSAWNVSGLAYGGTMASMPSAKQGKLTLEVSAVPVLIKLDTSGTSGGGGGGVGLEEEIYQRNNITIFPNPSSGDFTAEVELEEGGILETQLLNLSGQVLRSKEFDGMNAGKNRISFAQNRLTPGCYILRARLKNNPDVGSHLGKIIIAR